MMTVSLNLKMKIHFRFIELMQKLKEKDLTHLLEPNLQVSSDLVQTL